MYTRKEIIDNFKIIHNDRYEYNNFIFNNTHSKSIVSCSLHGDFLQTPKDHLRGRGCAKCKGVKNSYLKTHTTDQFIEKAKAVHGDTYDYKDVRYLNSNSKVTIGCRLHGSFSQIPSNHLSGKGCGKCGTESSSRKRTITTEEFIQKSKEVHGDKFDYSETNYVDDKNKVVIICPEHGKFYQNPSDHTRGKACVLCRNKLLSETFSHTTQQFIEKARGIHGDCYDYSKVVYTNDRTKIIIVCSEHGDFEQKPNKHLRRGGCPKCHRSIGESCLELIFIKNKIQHVKEFKLPFYKFEYDFYLPDYNLFVEFHGAQHYKLVPYFGGERGFINTKNRDAFKIDLARCYKIPLLEISYKNLHKKNGISEELILDILNKFKIRKYKSWVYIKI